jgi:hypothetical protein
MALPSTVGASAAAPTPNANARAARAHEIAAAELGRSAKPACGPVQPGFVRCLELVDTPPPGFHPTAGGLGYAPSDLQSAYNLPSTPKPKLISTSIEPTTDSRRARRPMAVSER